MAASDIVRTYTVTFSVVNPRKHWPVGMSTQDIVNQETVNRYAGEAAARLINRRDTVNFPYTATCVVTEQAPAAP